VQWVTTANTRRRKVLATEKRSLQKAVDLYHLHLRQYEKQRAKVQQGVVPGEGVVYRDFVNDHDKSGAKVCNLQLVRAVGADQHRELRRQGGVRCVVYGGCVRLPPRAR